MGVSELAEGAIKALIPPNTNDLVIQHKWRWKVFATLVTLIAAGALHVALACGYFPQVFPGFATTSDVSTIQKQVAIIATLNIEREIRSKAAVLCTEKTPSVRVELNEDIARLQKEYRGIVGDWYRVPRCEQL